MIKIIKSKIIKNPEIFYLFLLVLIAVISTSYYNFNKNKIYNNYKVIINNIYLKKTLNHFFNELEPRFKKINHSILPGETFDNILEMYSIKKSEIIEIRKKISRKVNLNKLNPNQKITFILDQSSSLIKEFTFQI